MFLVTGLAAAAAGILPAAMVAVTVCACPTWGRRAIAAIMYAMNGARRQIVRAVGPCEVILKSAMFIAPRLLAGETGVNGVSWAASSEHVRHSPKTYRDAEQRNRALRASTSDNVRQRSDVTVCHARPLRSRTKLSANYPPIVLCDTQGAVTTTV